MSTILTPLHLSGLPFQEFIADCLTEIDNRNERAERALRRATVHQLRELSVVRAGFMEASSTFDTLPDVGEYDGSVVPGFPRDILEVYSITAQHGGREHPVRGPAVVGEIRMRDRPGSRAPTPELWAWHEDKLLIAPRPNAFTTISIDYRRNGTLDEISGTPILPTANVETNGWFGRGVNALRCAVLWQYHASVSKDYELATVYEAQKLQAIDTITADWTLSHGSSFQTARIF